MVHSVSSILQLLNSIGKTKISGFFDAVQDIVPKTNEFKDITITDEMREQITNLLINGNASGEILASILTAKPNALDLLKVLSTKNVSRDILTLIVNIIRNKEEIKKIIVNESIKNFIQDLGTNLNTLRNLSYKKEVDNLIDDYNNGTLSINSLKPIENGIKKDAIEFITTMAPYIGQLVQSASDDPVNFLYYILQEVENNSNKSTNNTNRGKLLKRNKNIISMREVSTDAAEVQGDNILVVLYIVIIILIQIDTKKGIDKLYKLFDEIENVDDISEEILINEILSVPKSLTDLFDELKNSDDERTAFRENDFITSIIGTINESETTKDIITRLLKKTCIYIDDFNPNEIGDIELLPQDKFTLKKIYFAPLNDLLNITPKFQEITKFNENAENGLYIRIYEKVNADAVKEEIRQYIFINRNSNLKEVIHFAIKSLYYIVSAFSCIMKYLTNIVDLLKTANDIPEKYKIENVNTIKKGNNAVRNKHIGNFDKYGQAMIKLKSAGSYTQEQYEEAEKNFKEAQAILVFYDFINGDLKKIIYYVEKLLRNVMIVILPLFMTIWIDFALSVNEENYASAIVDQLGSSIYYYALEYINTLLNKNLTIDYFRSGVDDLLGKNDRMFHILEGNFYKMTTNGQVSYFSFINNNYDNSYAKTIFSGNNAKINTITYKDENGTIKTLKFGEDSEDGGSLHKLVKIKTNGFTINYDENYMIVNYLYGENTTIEPCYPTILDKGSYVNINNSSEKFTIDENNILTILNNNYKLDGNTYDVKTLDGDLEDVDSGSEFVKTTIGFYNGLYFITYNLFFNLFQLTKAFENYLEKTFSGEDGEDSGESKKANIDKINFIKTYNDVYTKKTYFLDLNIDNYSNNENIFLPYQMCFISYKDDTFIDIISRKVYKKEPEPESEPTILAEGKYHINLYNSDGSSINISTSTYSDLKTFIYMDSNQNLIAVSGKENITINGTKKDYPTITIQNDDGLKKKFYYDDKVKKYKTIKDGKWQTRTIKYGIAETPHTLTLNNNIFTTEVTFIMLNKKLNANANDKVLANVEEENYGKVGDGLEISGLEEKDIQNRGFFSLITTSDI